MSEAVAPLPENDASTAPRAGVVKQWWMAALLFVLAIVGYLPALFGDYTWDDDQWLQNNAAVHAWNGLHIIWNPFRQNLQYYPVTFTVLWLEHKCWGLAPAGYHAVNMLLHAGAAVMLWLCLRRLGLRGAWLGALLWAIHPVQVESVAWVSEIKNTLSGLFFFMAAWTYLRFEGMGDSETPKESWQRWAFYVATLLVFVAAMLSKTAVCTLPAGLFIVLWWKRRLTLRSLALIPLLLIGLGISALAAFQEHRVLTAFGSENLHFSIVQRAIICGKDVWFYLRTLVVPYPLLAIYPRWTFDTTDLLNFAAPLAIVIGLGLLAWRVSCGHRGMAAAVAFFLVTLSPALGFINFFTMHYTFVADHYDYLACAGMLVLAGQGIALLLAARPPVKLPIALLITGLLAGTMFYSSKFQTNMKLWSWNVAHNPTAFTAQHNLGIAYLNAGHPQEGIEHIQIALQLQPDDDNIQRTMARIARDNGDIPGAIAHLQRAIELRPRFGLNYKLLGDVYDRANDLPQALAAYEKSVTVDDTDPFDFIAYAEELKKAKQLDAAAAQYWKAIDLAPGNLITRYNYGNLLLDLNRPTKAIEQYEFILKYQDDARNGPIWHNLAYAYSLTDQHEKAVAAEERGRAIDAANGTPPPAPASAPGP